MPVEQYPTPVVVLKKSGTFVDQQGQAILEPPVQVMCRWSQKEQEVTMATPFLLPKGSQAWLGTLTLYNRVVRSLQAGQSLDIWVVVTNDYGVDIRGQEELFTSHLVPFSTSGAI